MRWIIIFVATTFLFASGEKNVTKGKSSAQKVIVEKNDTKEKNKIKQQSLLEKNIKKQMEKEKKYKKEQKFYEGKQYNTKELQVTPEDIKSVPVIEPEYDFDMSDID